MANKTSSLHGVSSSIRAVALPHQVIPCWLGDGSGFRRLERTILLRTRIDHPVSTCPRFSSSTMGDVAGCPRSLIPGLSVPPGFGCP